MIPAEAVEAAMTAWLDRSSKPGSWSLEEEVRAALEAAAPYIMAEAWEEGEAAGQDNAYAYQVGIAVKPNPYMLNNEALTRPKPSGN